MMRFDPNEVERRVEQVQESQVEPCEYCEGSGTVIAANGDDYDDAECPVCGGDGAKPRRAP